VETFLDLGKTGLANSFILPKEKNKPELKYPLRAGYCLVCHHVQLMDKVLPERMFENYLYMSSASSTLTRHLKELAEYIVENFNVTSDDLVVDVGCNDGALLKGFADLKVPALGIEPAHNLARTTQSAGLDVLNTYFSETSAKLIRTSKGPASIIVLTNVFPHLADLNDFMLGVSALLDDNGTLIIEAHYLRDLLDHLAFDTVYHEHVSYWSLTPAVALFEKFDLEVVDVKRLPIHHGQLRMIIKRKGTAKPTEAVKLMLQEEAASGMQQISTYHAFAGRVEVLKKQLQETLNELTKLGKRVAAYGAPAKGSTLLNYFDIQPDQIAYVADRNELKQGRLTPGTHIPIVHPQTILEDQPDYLLLLAWNFADEIIKQQSIFRERGGQFILPLPEVQIV